MNVIAIAASRTGPMINFITLTNPQRDADLTKAAGGAAAGTLGGMGLALLCLSNPFTAAACAGPIIAGGALLGGGIGLSMSHSADTRSEAALEASRAAAEAVRQEVKLQDLLRAAVIARARNSTSASFREPDIADRDHSSLAAEGVDGILEIELLRIEMSQPTLLRGATLTMTARAQLLRALNDVVLHRAEYGYTTEPLSPAEWTEGNADRLRKALRNGLDDLALQIVAGALIAEQRTNAP